jgi:cytochrome b involved in lipid metabolism
MIVIIGAGISGLTCAYELAKQGLDVVIYEKDSIAGGMAKSYLKNGIPTEHSWRGFMSFYHNVFNILNQLECTNTVESFVDLPYYTIDEISKHNKNDDAWIIYQGYVYDITYFIDKHPGGILINLSLGKDVEKTWNDYFVGWHLKNNEVIKVLTKNKIGIVKETFNNLSCLNTLTPIVMDKLYNNKKNAIKKISDFTFFYHFLKFFCGNKRNEFYYQKPLLNYISKNSLLYDHFITYLAGPGLGFDFNNASIGSIFFYMSGFIKHLFDKNAWYVTNRLTNDAFINPLVKKVESMGVKIIYNSELQKINLDSKTNKITSLIINNKNINGDKYVLAINPNMLLNVLKKSNVNNLLDDLILSYNGLKIVNNQISFRLGFNKKIKFSENKHGYVLMDSINNITFYPIDDFFNDKTIKSLWSGTCVQVYNNNMNKQQFIDNIINQFLECKDLQDKIYKNNNFKLVKEDFIYSEIFDEWKEVTNNGNVSLKSDYPKFVNTYINESYKPSQKTTIDNLILIGAHTLTSFKIWSMESACESGKIGANLLLNTYNKPLTKIYHHDQMVINKCISKIDDVLYDIGIPSIIDLLILIFIIWLMLKFFPSQNN